MTHPDLDTYTNARLRQYHKFCSESAVDFATSTRNGRMAWRRERDRVEDEIEQRFRNLNNLVDVLDEMTPEVGEQDLPF